MAVLVRIGNNSVYKGYNPWDEEYQKKADQFDAFLKKDIKRIEREVIEKGFKKKGGRGDNRCWNWVGGELRKILKHPTLHKLDRRWVMNVIEYYAPYPISPISGKNRSKSRNVYKYYLLLNEVPDNKREILEWGEWVTLFDSNSFHSDDRSMNWLKDNIVKFKEFKDKRKAVRTLQPLLNKNFCTTHRDLSYLSDEEFYTEINGVFSEFLRSINRE